MLNSILSKLRRIFFPTLKERYENIISKIEKAANKGYNAIYAPCYLGAEIQYKLEQDGFDLDGDYGPLIIYFRNTKYGYIAAEAIQKKREEWNKIFSGEDLC